MDPISIIAAAAAAITAVYSVTTTACSFLDGAVAIDRTTESFLTELKSFENAIVATKFFLEGNIFARGQYGGDEPFQEPLSSLASCLQNCGRWYQGSCIQTHPFEGWSLGRTYPLH
jgi:hypothetical protein